MENRENYFDFKSVMDATAQTDNSVTTTLMAQLDNCRLLCFDELLLPALDSPHLSFKVLCLTLTAVMDYLMLCEQRRGWIIEDMPVLTGGCSTHAQSPEPTQALRFTA